MELTIQNIVIMALGFIGVLLCGVLAGISIEKNSTPPVKRKLSGKRKK